MCILVHLILDMYCDICQTDRQILINISLSDNIWHIESWWCYILYLSTAEIVARNKGILQEMKCMSHVFVKILVSKWNQCPIFILTSSLNATQTHKANVDEIYSQESRTQFDLLTQRPWSVSCYALCISKVWFRSHFIDLK